MPAGPVRLRFVDLSGTHVAEYHLDAADAGAAARGLGRQPPFDGRLEDVHRHRPAVQPPGRRRQQGDRHAEEDDDRFDGVP